MKAVDYIDDKTLFALFKGDPGSGKSIAASTWLKKGPMYFFDFDGKIKAIINFWKKHNPELLKNLEFDHFNTYNEGAEKLAEFIDRGHPYTGGIAWDTLTTSVDSLLTQVTDVKGGGKKLVGNIAVNEIEDYNAESAGLTRLIQHAKFKLHKELKTNFFLLAHVVRTQTTEIKTGNIIESRSLITAGKKVAAKIPGYFDEIWHFYNEKDMETGAIGYRVSTQNSGTDFARTSMNMPPILKITYPATLYDLVQQELNVIKL